MTRRELLAKAGKLAVGAGIAVTAAKGIGGFSRAEAAKTDLPWPYEKLDPEECAKIAYEGWYKGFCSYGVASGLLIPLQKKIGAPYTNLPVEGLRLGEGGVVGWGTLCGSLLGATVALGFITPYETGKQITNEMLAWYSNTELPLFKPESPKAQVLFVSTSNSPLCHISVNKWCTKAGKSFASPERKDRCARVTADIARQTAIFLNQWKDGKFQSALKHPPAMYGSTSQHNCNECHPNKIPEMVK